ncbi:MAG: hypothetical protein ACE5FO_05430 [Parvularculaceae bacterium]
MARLRIIIPVFSWAIFIWLIFNHAKRMNVFESIWLNIGYVIGAAAAATFFALLIVVWVNRTIRLPAMFLIAIVITVTAALAAADVFWLREFFTQLE